MKSVIVKATVICGTLDILYAIVMAILGGGTALGVLHSVASGPFGASIKSWGWAGGLVGLGVHFTIMLVMVAAFVFIVKSVRILSSINTFVLGTIYGCLLYFVMYWVVLSLRWPSAFPQTDPMQIIKALIPHIFLVGIPLAFIAKQQKNRQI
ncbi:hypothetical protein GCM10011613_16240 [Cellvibrio zantedeschiae]|uniref:DUF1440 domain-containing protein n=1 Tax=Cellvibrio zantedeschiae TaxID=1237077 RepID=A0ABQ3AZ93_9GAMM|nr:hypothetical protein [Cellvibrio zantedeschiae]GGY72054.1 hypothetical protein GCM10011613_16240 [Cellvibrio zantedeschiae]